MMKRALTLLLAIILTACFKHESEPSANNAPQSTIDVKKQLNNISLTPLSPPITGINTDANNQTLRDAYARKQSDVWLEGAGTVVKLLPDDNKGARHQKFLVRINAEQTLLFAHNIDLAPRLDALQVGDDIQFKGEYIYNPKGGVMHWTHHDPQGRHGGWIKLNGQIYE
jgi:Protein of unknown function (DUF3465)